MDGSELRAMQAPIKRRYKDDPNAAVVTLKAKGTLDNSNIACKVETGRALAAAGLHPATGGSGLELCSGDMLLEALVACAGVTLKAVATALDIPLRSGRVSAEGELDFRGTLGVAKDAPVGFREIRLRFDLDTDAAQDKLDQLLKLTERYCVVYQTIGNGPPVDVKLARIWESSLSLDLYFALTLGVKMAITAGFLLAATVMAERFGPRVGGLVATLPISAGPVYIFLALDHDAHFIAQSALGSLVTNAFNVVFALSYALLAQKRTLSVSLAGAFAAWIALAGAGDMVAWTIAMAVVLNTVAVGFAFWLSAPLRHAPMPRVHTRWYDLVLRAAMVALLVGTVITLSFRIGPTASGNLAVFPIVLTSIMIILHHRVGGPATAAVMANAVIGLGGFAIAVIVLNLTADRLGSPLALSLTLAVSLGCNLLLYVVRQRSVTK